MLRSLCSAVLPRGHRVSRALPSLLAPLRFQSAGAPEDLIRGTPDEATVTFAEVWSLWNEGNLFSLSVAQMQAFLTAEGVPPDPTLKKAGVVRRLEELLHQREKAGAPAAAGAAAGAGEAGAYGRWDRAPSPPETLLDLAQSGFYDGAVSMAPRAFQLLLEGSATDAAVVRLPTAGFPGFPATTECYTLVGSDGAAAAQVRFSRVLQWCYLNMSNLQMDGELTLSLGKLVLEPRVARRGETILSAYALQQRLQLTNPYLFVSAVPDRAVPAAEAFLAREGFTAAAGAAQLTYEGTVKRARDQLELVLDHTSGALVSLGNEWVALQTSHFTRRAGPDVRLQLRSRAPPRGADLDTFRAVPVIRLEADDITDVLPPEHGQLVYLSENETRRFQKALPAAGLTVTVTEVKRQPLIILRDDEEDARVEYSVSVSIPAQAAGGGGAGLDIRAVGNELVQLADRFAAELKDIYVEDFGCALPDDE